MKISVKVKTNARENVVKEIEGGQYEVLVTTSPTDGKANEAVIRLLADFFNKPPTMIVIVRGHTSRKKIIEIG